MYLSEEAMKRRIATLVLLALVNFAASASPVAAQSPEVRALYKKKVSLELKDLPLRRSFEKLFEGTNLPVVVDPNVPDPKVTAKWTDQTVHEIFHALVKRASTPEVRLSSVFGLDAALVVVNPNTPEEEKQFQFLGAGRKVKLSLKDVPLQRAMDLIFMGSGLQYSIHPAAAKLPITVELKDAHIELALSLLESAVSKTTPLAVTKQGDVYYVRVAP
jgi:type II secretory pathway component GspD/PulD (secretin)